MDIIEIRDEGPRLLSDLMMCTGLDARERAVLSVLVYYYNSRKVNEDGFIEIHDMWIKRYVHITDSRLHEVLDRLERFGFISIDHEHTRFKCKRLLKPLVHVN